MAEVIEGLKNHGYLATNELNIMALDIDQAKLVTEGLEMFYKDMERLDKDFGAEITMTRQITCWADLYTAEDSVQNQLKKIINDMKSFVVIQYSLLRYLSEE